VITHLRGTLVDKTLDRVVVECGGVGYSVIVSLGTLAQMPAVGAEVTVLTYLQVREDAHVLYGFAHDSERRAFELCTSVSGIGPKLAVALLSTLRPEALAEAVRAGDVARLSKTPGIGKRTAERIVVELKDRLDKLGPGPQPGAPPGPAGARLHGSAQVVAQALVNLGYKSDAAERAAREATADADAPLEEQLKQALRLLTG